MKPEHKALVKRLNDVALAHAHYGTDDAPMSADAADAIVSLSAELARYSPAIGYAVISASGRIVDIDGNRDALSARHGGVDVWPICLIAEAK